jgi:hypothetical protein
MPETKRQMIARGSLFGTPGYLWLGARSRATAQYRAAIAAAIAAPSELVWSEKEGALFV